MVVSPIHADVELLLYIFVTLSLLAYLTYRQWYVTGGQVMCLYWVINQLDDYIDYHVILIRSTHHNTRNQVYVCSVCSL